VQARQFGHDLLIGQQLLSWLIEQAIAGHPQFCRIAMDALWPANQQQIIVENIQPPSLTVGFVATDHTRHERL
jgi:hypothetical protein